MSICQPHFTVRRRPVLSSILYITFKHLRRSSVPVPLGTSIDMSSSRLTKSLFLHDFLAFVTLASDLLQPSTSAARRRSPSLSSGNWIDGSLHPRVRAWPDIYLQFTSTSARVCRGGSYLYTEHRGSANLLKKIKSFGWHAIDGICGFI